MGKLTAEAEEALAPFGPEGESLRALAELPVRFTQVIEPGEIRAAALQ